MKRWVWSLAILIISVFAAVHPGQAVEAAQPFGCFQTPRLSVGGQGMVSLYPSIPNTLRLGYSKTSTAIGSIPPGGVFTVLSGPICNGGWNWWQVNYYGSVGWTAEGDGVAYWLEPAGIIPPPPPPVGCPLSSRLSVGMQAFVTRGVPNNIRSGPATSYSRIGQIPGGAVFTVIGGAQCDSYGRWWWQVNYNGIIGYTAEGSRSVYWVEPVGIYPTPTPAPYCRLATRLYVGGYGRVTPGTPNVVRSAPGTTSSGANSVVVGHIPGEGVFHVVNGPQCGPDGRWWWYVNYNGLLGWTAEGEGFTYWLEPVY